jgi:Meiotically Up-regulated Gene 113 (MUG113) protein
VNDPAWFVYLFALTDCSAFKVGFSCNPFQRIHTFSRRYYERFDVAQSLLLRLDSEADARAIEAMLKSELAKFRTESPDWVPLEAGGHTEWFSAVQLGSAAERLRSFIAAHEDADVVDAGEYFRGELQRMSGSFEPWAWSQAQQACDASASVYTLRSALAIADSLRDWLDAYRYFDVPLFHDDPAVLGFVSSVSDSARFAGRR